MYKSTEFIIEYRQKKVNRRIDKLCISGALSINCAKPDPAVTSSPLRHNIRCNQATETKS